MTWRWMLLCLLFSPSLLAQKKDTVRQAVLLVPHFSYGLHTPGGDWQARYGRHSSLSLGIDMMNRRNWILGLEGSFLFGDQVKEDVLAPLRTDDGFLVGNDRNPANILLRMRGIYLGGHLGKVIPLQPDHSRSGIKVQLGIGLLQHKVRIQLDPSRSVNQLTGDYRKGYDRLTNGLALRQFIGYQLQSDNGLINIYIGLDAIQAFTRSRRAWDFDLQRRDEQDYLDLNWGLRAGLMIPIQLSARDGKVIYY